MDKMDHTRPDIKQMRKEINDNLRKLEVLNGKSPGTYSLPDSAPHIVEYGDAVHFHSANISGILFDMLGQEGGVYVANESVVLKKGKDTWLHLKGKALTSCSLGDISADGIGHLVKKEVQDFKIDELSVGVSIQQLVPLFTQALRVLEGVSDLITDYEVVLDKNQT